ncbi:MAG: iron ABC transporter substrate-binding protein [Chloroflexota bacterium]|nr:iron ABC transporter substrate-binding protein [Chloroflexota bacterium]
MTRVQNGSLSHTRRSVIRAGAVMGGSLAGIAVGIPAANARQEATPGASPVVSQVGGTVTIYSGRSEELIGPAIELCSEATGVEAEVRYGQTAELAATIVEEGENSPASLYIAQDAGALGQLAQEGRLAELPESILARVDERFRSPDGQWVGLTGRARVLVYNTEILSEDELPESVFDLTNERWQGQVGWAPENGSFQAFVTAMRQVVGEEQTREWLEGMIANNAESFESNGAITRAVGAGEIPVGLVNHYYMYEVQAEEGEELPIANYYFPNGDVGSLINVAGAAVLQDAPDQEQALAMLDCLLSQDAQQYFADTTFEYPLIEGVEPVEELPPLSEIDSPDIDLSDLADLQGTLDLLRDVGAI